MIDTLRLKSPAISEELAAVIENHLVQRTGVDMSTGEELYNICSGSLPGSWSSSVAVNVLRSEWVMFPARWPGEKRQPEKVACAPYVVIEGSAHKAMMGHNVFGGPERLKPAIAWFVSDVGRRMDVELPPWAEWTCDRVDVAEVYDMGSFEAVAQYLHGLGLARFPRRQPRRYGDECVFFAGTTTAFKFYHKGPEFQKNGKHYERHCCKVMGTEAGKEHIRSVQSIANCYLRVECSIKAKKLDQLYGGKPLAMNTALQHLEGVHDHETGRVLREAQQHMEMVRTTDEVRARLREFYDERLATLLFGTWLQLAAIGEDGVRRSVPRRTYYRHRTQLAEAGIAWDATDVYIREQSFIPAGFRPVRTDPRRVCGESLEVKKALLPFAYAG